MIGLLLKKLPKLILVLIVFITVFLLGFLLIGCMDTPNTFSDVYLVELRFNESAPLDSNIERAHKTLNKTSDLSSLRISTSYLAMCVEIGGTTTCASSFNTSSFAGVSVQNTKSEANIDLLQVARVFSSNCHPRLLLAVLGLTVILFFVMIWAVVPFIPGKIWAKRISCGLLGLDTLLWGLGAMLQHEAVTSAKKFITASSAYLIQIKLGTRAEAISWTSFSFLLLTCIGTCALYARDMLVAKNGPPLNKL